MPLIGGTSCVNRPKPGGDKFGVTRRAVLSRLSLVRARATDTSWDTFGMPRTILVDNASEFPRRGAHSRLRRIPNRLDVPARRETPIRGSHRAAHLKHASSVGRTTGSRAIFRSRYRSGARIWSQAPQTRQVARLACQSSIGQAPSHSTIRLKALMHDACHDVPPFGYTPTVTCELHLR
jgi:hypothetical protein